SNVINDGSHGMNCFSTIAANIPGQFIGKAPKASFWLYRTEDDASEYPIEEHNWVCAAERADSSGADLISSSLGYFDFDNATLNYVYANMNGNTTISAQGADVAAKKGLLVVLSAGNEGNGGWHYITTPSDADSVICVGAVSAAGNVGGFSSYGPSSDGQVKPDMAAVGVAAMVQTTGNTIGTSNGTSFACPNMAGLSSCLWQGFPEYNNMKIIKALQQAGSISTSPNDRIGYGIPNVKTAFKNLLIEYATSSASVSACTATITWSTKDVSAMKFHIERKAPGETVFTKVGELNPSAGTILANHNYTFTNTLINVNAGDVFYRIRQIIDTAVASFADA
ncbi:MAG: S8 family serine peptidase, partial [Chitinophagaceae bacterium]|nr:S8 family serine peptidase [Chitinophagaceae bacterium]